MNKICWIISGGEFDEIIPEAYDFVIACDKGYEYATKLNVVPDIVVGDFDSFAGIIEDDIKKIVLPAAKDDTDTGFAVKYALSQGAKRIVISCALGGRPDHMYSNFQTLGSAAKEGALATIISDDSVIYALCGDKFAEGTAKPISLRKKPGWIFSVFSFTDKCTGVNITGARYPLNNGELTNTFPLGQSNDWDEDEITISCSKGIILVIETKITEQS